MSTQEMIDLVMAIATVAMTIFTGWMAYETKTLAKESLDTSDLMEKHHQEALAPILDFHAEKIEQGKGGIGMSRRSQFEPCICEVGGVFNNSGPGPAVNTTITIIIPGAKKGISLSGPPVGSLSKREFFRRESLNGITTEDADAYLRSHHLWEMLIEYTDIFGNPYSTRLVNIPNVNEKEIIYKVPFERREVSKRVKEAVDRGVDSNNSSGFK